jgi:hypothetical protein
MSTTTANGRSRAGASAPSLQRTGAAVTATVAQPTPAGF